MKEAAYRLNKLSIDQNGRSNEARFFGIDHDIVEPSLFHVFGSLCFVLDACLQSGIAGVPKWEPRSRLGIYVGHSPSHAGSVALVLNPKTGHVSPQFHVVFDDAFSTVPYMDQKQVPPNWASLVDQSRELVTQEQYDLAENWLTNPVQPSDPLPESNKDSPLSQVDLNQGLDTEPANNPDTLSSPVDVNKSLNTESRASEEVSNASQRETSAQQVQQVPQYVPEDQVSTEDGKDERHVSFNLDNPSTIGAQISTQNEPPKLPDTLNVNPSALNPSPTATPMLPVCEGEMSNVVPNMINLETSGLRRSERIRKKNPGSTNSGPSVMAYTSSSRNERPFLKSKRKKPRLAFFSVFCSIGTLWSFATLSMPHFTNGQCHSFVARVSNDYERVNGLFDDTINDVIHHV